MKLISKREIRLCHFLLAFLLILLLNTQPSVASTKDSDLNISIGGETTPVILGQEMFYPNFSVGLENFGFEFGGNSINFQHDDSYDFNSTTYSFTINASLDYYVANLKYYFLTKSLVRPHWGVGLVNFSLTGDGETTQKFHRDYGDSQTSRTFNISTNLGGYNFQLGLDLPLKSFDIPIVLVAGINHYHFHSFDIDASTTRTYTSDTHEYTHEDKIEETINYSLTFFNYHFGLRYEF